MLRIIATSKADRLIDRQGDNREGDNHKFSFTENLPTCLLS